jgi:hypothetical protein
MDDSDWFIVWLVCQRVLLMVCFICAINSGSSTSLKVLHHIFFPSDALLFRRHMELQLSSQLIQSGQRLVRASFELLYPTAIRFMSPAVFSPPSKLLCLSLSWRPIIASETEWGSRHDDVRRGRRGVRFQIKRRKRLNNLQGDLSVG